MDNSCPIGDVAAKDARARARVSAVVEGASGREIQSQAEGSPASFAEGQTGMVKHGLTFLL
jgi:hypothetical protein